VAAAAATIGLAAPAASAGVVSGGLPRHVFAPYFETYDTAGGGQGGQGDPERGASSHGRTSKSE
jgi:hypothetical protein